MTEYSRIITSDFTPKILIYLNDAIKRHPDFVKTKQEAISIITEELGELAKEVNDGNAECAKIELFHCIATLLRLYHTYLVDDELEKNTEAFLSKEVKCG